MVQKWETLSSHQIADCRIFQVNEIIRKSPATNKSHKFYTLHSRDWVNIIALTPANKVVMVRQYRHGIDDIALEIPSGIVEENDPAPAETARRELLEETGYDAEKVILLGAVYPNPAFLDNQCRIFLAANVHKMANQNLEETEDISIEEVDIKSVPSMIIAGTINHSLTVAAFYLLEHYRPFAK
ncbi:MAG: NUDIX hydrolase [Parcubacteria group bacterium]|nr:NUDIX hydrolase [Parcubacteria group bacterium]